MKRKGNPSVEHGSCWIGVHKGPRRAMLRALLAMPSVVRVTSHGGHLKVVARGRFRPPPGLLVERVKDQTKHTDVRLWDFATAIARHAIAKKHSPEMVVGILAHYLANVFHLPETQLLAMLATKRQYIDAAVSDEEAHGWELPVARRLAEKLKGWEA